MFTHFANVVVSRVRNEEIPRGIKHEALWIAQLRVCCRPPIPNGVAVPHHRGDDASGGVDLGGWVTNWDENSRIMPFFSLCNKNLMQQHPHHRKRLASSHHSDGAFPAISNEDVARGVDGDSRRAEQAGVDGRPAVSRVLVVAQRYVASHRCDDSRECVDLGEVRGQGASDDSKGAGRLR